MTANVVLGCVMALLLILFSISSIARYYIKFTLFVVMSLIFATAPVPLMLIKPFDPRNALIPAFFLRCFARILGLRWEVRGLENVDNSRGAVVLLNHQSCLDLYALAIIWPLMSRCTVVSKRSLQYLVPFGTATWLWGTVFIDRGAQTARDALNKQVDAIKNQKVNILGWSVPDDTKEFAATTTFLSMIGSISFFFISRRKLLLFPEGTRHSGDKLLPLRKGAFHVAMDAAAPIQPVVISKYHYLDGDRHKFGSGEFILSILPMIETEGMSKEDIVGLIEKTQINMQEEFTKISMETLARRNLRTKAD